jgi:hypothetical protein
MPSPVLTPLHLLAGAHTLHQPMAMAHNHEAGGSGAGDHPLSLNIEEASILSENNILVPPGWKLPHGWRIWRADWRCLPFRWRAGDGGLHRAPAPSSAAGATQQPRLSV